MASDFEPMPMPGARPSKSGLVTAGAIVHFVFGGLALICACMNGIAGLGTGLVSAVGGAAHEALEKEIAKQPADKQAEVRRALELARTWSFLFWLIAVLSLLLGPVAIVAGIGMIQRKPLGKMMSFAAVGIALLVAIISGVSVLFLGMGQAVGLGLYLAYAVFILIVLFNPQASRELS